MTAALSVLVSLALAVRFHGHPAWLPAYLYLGVAGSVLAVFDARHHRLPDVITLPSYPIGAALFGLAAGIDSDGHRFARMVIAAAAVWFGFMAMWVVARGGLGLGDVKLSGLLGGALGWLGWSHVLAGLLLGMVIAGVCASVLLVTRRVDRRARLAYGPFLLLGTLLGLLLA